MGDVQETEDEESMRQLVRRGPEDGRCDKSDPLAVDDPQRNRSGEFRPIDLKKKK